MARLDIRTKIAGLVFAAVSAVVVAMTVHAVTSEVESERAALVSKAQLYGALAQKELEPAVAFADRETVREVFEQTAADHDVAAAELVDSEGRSLGAIGQVEASAPAGGVQVARIDTSGSRFTYIGPVTSREGRRGTLVLELSTHALAARERRAVLSAVAYGLAALFVGFAAAWLIGGSFARRVRAIEAATKAVAQGRRGTEIRDDSDDEIGQLARNFGVMSRSIESLVEEIRSTAGKEQQRLDGLVAERTEALDRRNATLRMFLDHVGQGFLGFDRDGVIGEERAAIVDHWFGACHAGATFAELVRPIDPRFADAFAVSYSAVFEDVMPLELSIEQLPRRIRDEERDRTFDVEYTPRGNIGDSPPNRILCVVTDVTSRWKHEQAEASRIEQAALFEKLVSDRRLVDSFFREADAITKDLASGGSNDLAAIKRKIHTLKGNAGMMGLDTLARACHALEDEIAERQEAPSKTTFETLAGAVADLKRLAAPTLASRRDDADVKRADIAALLGEVREGAAPAAIAECLEDWLRDPVAPHLTRLGRHASKLASKLGKHHLRVVIEPSDVRVDATALDPFFASLVHVVGNSVDHGVESLDERIARGKPAEATLTLSAKETADGIVVEISDDGAGIDWEALRSRAVDLGVVARGDDVLFEEGVTSRAGVTMTSGRGVGLGAVREACRRAAGDVSVTSTRGHGTTFTFTFPRAPKSGPRISRRSSAA